MSQLWKVGASWLNIEQIRAPEKEEEEKSPVEEEDVIQEVIKEEEEVTPVVTSVEDIIPAVKSDVFVESELAEMTVLELREIAKQNSVRIIGQPSKLAIINILMNKK